LAQTLFISGIFLKYFAVNFDFKYFVYHLQNKQYLTAVFMGWFLLCEQLLSEYFAEIHTAL